MKSKRFTRERLQLNRRKSRGQPQTSMQDCERQHTRGLNMTPSLHSDHPVQVCLGRRGKHMYQQSLGMGVHTLLHANVLPLSRLSPSVGIRRGTSLASA